MEITLGRDQELGSEPNQLPAETYNLTRILLKKSDTGNVFVPIRSMQYLAIIDNQEILFIDGNFKNLVVVAWTDFQPQLRLSLQSPVQYITRRYRDDGREIMARLQSEFPAALVSYSNKQPTPHETRVIRLVKREDH